MDLPANQESEAEPSHERAIVDATRVPDPAEFYDVAISFTARDQTAARLAEELAGRLRTFGLAVFYYAHIEEAAKALGERLGELLPSIYRDRARVVVIVASPHYGHTVWTGRELAAALDRPRDDAGRWRLLPVSADGSSVSGLPADLLHLGGAVGTTETVDGVARLVAERCGVRPGRWRSMWPLSLAALAAAGLASQFLVAGALDTLAPWVVMSSLIAMGTALVAFAGPRLWLARRRAAAVGRLAVITEGRGLQSFRGYLAAAAVVAGSVSALMLAVTTWTVIDARLTLRDVRMLADQSAASESMRRFDATRSRLAPFESTLIPVFESAIRRNLQSGAWLDFPALYRQYLALSGRPSPTLENAYWQASGTAALSEGDDVLDHIQTASELRDSAPALARRQFETVLARLLEWQMSGNDFYYGANGPRAWDIYRRLEQADGIRAWANAHRTPTLPNNSGLTPQIMVYLAEHDDRAAFGDIVAALHASHVEPALLSALSDAAFDPESATAISTQLREYWSQLHVDDGPIPVGFALAAAIARQDVGAESYLLDRAARGASEQERAHALNGLQFMLMRGQLASQSAAANALRAARTDAGRQLEQLAASGRMLRTIACDDAIGQSLETSLRLFSQSTSRGDRSPAGLTSEPQAAGLGSDEGQRTLEAYLAACGDRADPVLVADAQARFGGPAGASTAPDFFALRREYEDLATAVPGAADSPEVLHLVELLEAIGRSGVSQAAGFLASRFDTLPHGNMTVAAAEGLLRLNGAFGPEALAEISRLLSLSSSVYRTTALDMLARNAGRLTDTDERETLVRLVSKVSVSGEPSERGHMLDVLSRLDPPLARRRAFFMTLSSNADDRLEGIERLWTLWAPLPGNR